MAILCSYDNDDRMKYIGWIETAGGIGMLLGPLIGAFLYSQGGFMLPFQTFGKYSTYAILNYSYNIGGLLVFVFPFVCYKLVKSMQIENQLRTTAVASDATGENISQCTFFTKIRFVFATLALLINSLTGTYLLANIALQMNKIGFSPS